eukprot:c15494_g1_i1.p1 GENE.c15494_g1_i1~~c15494_g1_i1.p1  ORF type:complete len:462 (+),score=64.04 c15494_g1_i1:53-1387(+)
MAAATESSMSEDGHVTVPRFRIDLDLPPAERWVEVATVYRQEFIAVKDIIEGAIREELGAKLGAFLQTLVTSLLSFMATLKRVFYADELRGIAEATGVPLGSLIMLQLVYEASAMCTSIVAPSPDASGAPHHIRTMDWAMEFLRPLTVEFDFVRGGETVLVATSWAGYVGVLTGMRPGGWSASVNFRVTEAGSYWMNVKRALAAAWPVGFLLRAVLESESAYADALTALADSDVIAPVYFTVCGIAPGEGAILTRERRTELERWLLSERGPAVQTNMDFFDSDPAHSIMDSIARRELAADYLERHDAPSEAALWELLSRRPICNEITVYGAYMNPRTGRLRTIIPHARVGFRPHDEPAVVGAAARVPCRRCGAEVTPSLNAARQCAHVGDWHAVYADCSKMRCAWGLKTNIGAQHWSCCYSVTRASSCPKSGTHDIGDGTSSDE